MKLLRLIGSTIVLSTLGAIAIACSSPDKGGTAEGACAQYADAFRSYSQKCNENGGSLTSTRWQAIQGRMQAACGSALSLPGTGITPSAVTSCASALKGASCDVDSDDIPQCEFANGTLADGAACSDRSQCSSGSCKRTITETGSPACGVCDARVAIGGACTATTNCVKDARCDTATKKCVAIVRNGAGGSCDLAKGESCQSGLYCDLEAKVCKAPGAAGAACTSSSECKEGLSCDASSKCVAAALATEGQPCGDTTAAKCATGLMCDFTASKCIKPVWVAPGGDCSAAGSVCEHGGCGTTKKCPALIPDGQPCTTDRSAGVCDDFASCVEGKCSLAGQTVCK